MILERAPFHRHKIKLCGAAQRIMAKLARSDGKKKTTGRKPHNLRFIVDIAGVWLWTEQ
jgi:hypothetical protein